MKRINTKLTITLLLVLTFCCYTFIVPHSLNRSTNNALYFLSPFSLFPNEDAIDKSKQSIADSKQPKTTPTISVSLEDKKKRITEGYSKGKTKYIFVIKTDDTHLRKGISASSLSLLLKQQGLTVVPMVLDYLVDPDQGVHYPYLQSELVVLDDQIPQDHYRSYPTALMLSQDEFENLKLGKPVSSFLDKLNTFQRSLRSITMTTQSDVVIVEIGQTITNSENIGLLTILKQFILDEGHENTATIVTMQGTPENLKHGKDTMQSFAFTPDILILDNATTDGKTHLTKDDAAAVANVDPQSLVMVDHAPYLSTVPLAMNASKLDVKIMDILKIDPKANLDDTDLESIKELTRSTAHDITVGVVGDFAIDTENYANVKDALLHAGVFSKANVQIKWIDATSLEKKSESELSKTFFGIDAMVVPGGYGSSTADGKLNGIHYARTHNVPFLGICLGFQLALVEFSQNVCGLEGAHTVEINPQTPHPIFLELSDLEKKYIHNPLRWGSHKVSIIPGTLISRLYDGHEKIQKQFQHRFGFNPAYIETLRKHGLIISNPLESTSDLLQLFELSDHPFFVGGQYHPEMSLNPKQPDGLFQGLINAALAKKERERTATFIKLILSAA